jgi:hypothetical protein
MGKRKPSGGGRRKQRQAIADAAANAVAVSSVPAPGRSLAPPSTKAVAPGNRALAGGRISFDSDIPWYSMPHVITSPLSADDTWRTLDLDSKTLETLSPTKLIELLADVSPDVSRALFDFLRMCNPGWEATALRTGSDEPDPRAQAAIDAFTGMLDGLYGSIDVVINRLFTAAFVRGAFLSELVLDKSGRRPVDLVTPDPATIRFQVVNDPERGQTWELGQWHWGQWTALDRETISYVAIDPMPGWPYGRPLAAPALFSTLFLIGLLHDLRRVVSQQGYPRLDLSVDMAKLTTSMPMDLANDPQAAQLWVSGVIADVQRVYASLEPDDAYIHTDVISVNRPVGAVDAQSLGAVDGLVKSLERMSVRALKTMPLLMGLQEGTSETQANRQWEIYAAGIKALQHPCEKMLQRHLSLALQAQGIQADVSFRFSELRAAELLRDAQVDALETETAVAQYNAGWISQDEAAQNVVGHAADVPDPRAPTGPISMAGNSLAGVQADPGSNRARVPDGMLGPDGEIARLNRKTDAMMDLLRILAESYEPASDRSVKIVPEGADDPLPPVPDEVTISDADIRMAIDAWDTLIPDYAGLLEATVIGQSNFDDQQHAAGLPGTRAYGDASPWVWDPRGAGGGRYRNTDTGEWAGAKQMLGLRDRFVEAQKGAIDDLGAQLVKGDINVQQWVLQSRQYIKTAFIDEYALGHGGRHNMTQKDFGIIGHMCRDQYDFLNNFGEQVANGELSADQIRVRARMYIDASVQAYERAVSERLGLPRMPAYPGDGSTECRANCKCHWQYEETDTAWNCTWVVHSAAENCATCLERGAMWAPYVVDKATLAAS